ncbi:MAG: C-terminal binding protein [Proteobacteria bacterium]|nr:C-terminal binding protein [Pseudomonadota bacterium]
MGNLLAAVVDSPFPSLDPAKEVLSALGAELRMAEAPTPDAILKVARHADALFVTYGQVTGEIIDALEKCKVIGRFGIGIDNIDIPAASRAGIIVTYAPVYCLDEVSDQAMAMLLALARKIPFANKLVQDRRWEMPAVVPLHRIRGRTLGLVGLGNIPQLVAPKAQAFGIKVIAADPFAADEIFRELDVEKVEFDDLLARSDYISIHAPLLPETEKMFNAEAFKKMKPDALLINTARGPLVDTEALADALEAGEIGGAALDVLPVEPPAADDRLLGRDDVILTPHTGFYSEDALRELQTTVATDVAAVLSGKAPKYPVNAAEVKT